MLPDVVRDNVTDCAKRQGFKFTEQVFYEACKDAGFSNAQDRAMALNRLWIREGYDMLPDWTKDYILRQCENVVH